MRATGIPASAASASSNNVYPSANAQLFAHSEYNLTAGIQAPAINTVFDSANLEIEKEGSPYSNTSLTPLGTFPGNYSFEQVGGNNRPGGLPTIPYITCGGSCTQQVVTAYLGHQQVVQLYDNGAGGGLSTSLGYDVSATGEVSAWMTTSSATVYSYPLIAFSSGGTLLWGVSIYNNLFYYLTSSGWVSTGKVANANQWYYFYISYSTVAFTFYVDGAQLAAAIAYYQVGTVGKILTGTDETSSGYTMHVDALANNIPLGANAVDQSLLGVYNATYSFERDTIFAVPTGWGDESTGAGCRVYAAPAIATAATGHRNVMIMEDKSVSYLSAATKLFDPMVSGSIEFWVYASQVTNNIFFRLLDTAWTIGPQLAISGGNLIGYNGGWITLQAVSAATWYHTRVTFSTVTHTYNVYVNGLLRGNNLVFTNTTSGFLKQFRTNSENANQHWWALDAFDLSSDPCYVPERSTYLFLNQTQSFAAPGSYSFRYQAWSANVNYDSPWTPFTVVPNVQLISESTATTKWQTYSPSTMVLINLNTTDFSSWTSNQYETFKTSPQTLQGDSYVNEGSPATNYGNDPAFQFGRNPYSSPAGNRYYAWIDVGMPAAYLSSNITYTWLNMTGAGSSHSFTYNNHEYDISETTTAGVTESTINWNNFPAIGSLITTIDHPNAQPNIYQLATSSRYIAITPHTALSGIYGGYSREMSYLSYLPKSAFTISKFYRSTNLAYVQANNTETLSLLTKQFANITLSPNDQFYVTFNTTSSRQISMNIKSGGITQQTIILNPEGNTNFATQSKIFAITVSSVCDQVEFIGIFEDTKNMQFTRLTIDRPLCTDLTQNYLEPQSSKNIVLTPGPLIISVFAGISIVYNISVTILTNSLNVYTYVPTKYNERVILYYDTDGKPINYNNFWTNITRTFEGVTTKYLSSIDRFSADDSSYVTIEIWDKFGNLLLNNTQPIENFIDIIVPNLFSVKIQNKMLYSTLLTISFFGGYSYSQYIAQDEIIEYLLFATTYTLTYDQNEIGTIVSDTLVVSAPRFYTLNSSYRHVYISAYSADAPNIHLDSFRLFIDGTQYFWGWNYLFDGSYAVVVKDWFDANVYAAMRSVSDDSPINLPLVIYSLKIQNLMRTDAYFSLNSPGGYLDKYLLAGTETELFLGGGNYQLLYTQTETNTPVIYNFVLAGAMRYVINTSYCSIYFSAFSNDGQGVPTDSVRLYVDYFRQSWGPVEILGPNHNVTVLDYFNDTVFSQVLDLSTYSEFNVFVNIAWMSLYNNNTEQYYTFSIEKNATMLLTQAVAPQNFLLFRFTTGSYNVTAFYQNGTLFESRNITLTANSSNLLSFGVIAPDFTSVYASQLYNYALFRDLIVWSPNLADDYKLFYAVEIVNYLNATGTVFFEYLGTITSITVSANTPYLTPLYVPKGAQYRLFNNGTNEFLNTTWTPVSTNTTSSEYVLLNFGFYQTIQIPDPRLEGSSVIDIFIIIIIFAIATILAFLSVRKPIERGPFHEAMKHNTFPLLSTKGSGNPADDHARFKFPIYRKKTKKY